MLIPALLFFLVIVSSITILQASAEGEYFLTVKSNPNIIFIGGGGLYSEGSMVTLDAAPETWREYTLVGWKIDGRWTEGNPITVRMDRSHSVEAVYTKDIGGEIIVDTIPRIAEITIDGEIYLPTELPAKFTWDTGTEHTILIPKIVTESSDTRFVFDSWKDLSKSELRTITVQDEESNYIVLYKTQHFLKPISEEGTVVGGGWTDEGTTATFGLESDEVIDRKNENIRYIFESWDLGDYPNSPSNTIDVLEPIKVKANWAQQYRLELKTSVPDYNLFGTGWYDEERQVALIAEDELDSPNSDIKYVFEKWVSRGPNPVIIPNSFSSSTTITVEQPYVIEALYKESYRVNVWSPYGTILGGDFYKEGEIAKISLAQTEIVTSLGKEKKIFSAWNTYGARTMTPEIQTDISGATLGVQNLFLLVDKPLNVTANWKSLYYVDVQSTHSKAKGSGWYEMGRLVPISIDDRSTPPGMWSSQVFDKWVGDVESSEINARVLVNGPKTIFAEWREDNTPGIINSIILAAIAGITALVYKKTHFSFLTSKESKILQPSFDKFFSMKKKPSPVDNTPEFYQTKKKSIVDWLLDRD